MSGNHLDDMLRSEVQKALEAAAEATKKGIEVVVDAGRKAVDAGKSLVDTGVRKAGEVWNGITGGAKRLWNTLF